MTRWMRLFRRGEPRHRGARPDPTLIRVVRHGEAKRGPDGMMVQCVACEGWFPVEYMRVTPDALVINVCELCWGVRIETPGEVRDDG